MSVQSYFNQGTVNVTLNTTTVTGTGTAWVGSVFSGDIFVGPDHRCYMVAQVISATEILLSRPYIGTTETAAEYEITFTQGRRVEIEAKLGELISEFEVVQGLASDVATLRTDVDVLQSGS